MVLGTLKLLTRVRREFATSRQRAAQAAVAYTRARAHSRHKQKPMNAIAAILDASAKLAGTTSVGTVT